MTGRKKEDRAMLRGDDYARLERLADSFVKDEALEQKYRECQVTAEGYSKLPINERIELGHYLEKREARRRVEIERRREAAREQATTV